MKSLMEWFVFTSQTLSTNNPPDLRPQLDKGTSTDDMGQTCKFFQANSHNCGRSSKRWKCLLECGEFTAHVIFGGIDVRFIRPTTATQIETDRGALGGTDANGTNIFINLDINNGNTNDITNMS